jgi:hypothetical protein
VKHCVIFSSWITENSLPLGEYYLDILKKYHEDSDVFIGVNNKSCTSWVDMLTQRNFIFEVNTSSINIDSDVSGFMAALNIFKRSQTKYKAVWFAHTKGSSYSSPEKSLGFRKYLEQNFWGNKDLVDVLFNNPNVGLISTDFMFHNNKNIDKVLNKLFPFEYNDADLFTPNTFFITDGISILPFIFSENFTLENINVMEDKRYFFEAYFCATPIKMGKDYLKL